MPRRAVRLSVPANDALLDGFATIRADLGIEVGFPAKALGQAERAALAPRLPDLDLTEIPFVTLDPPSSRDLDQAFHLERHGGGYRVRYAIADVAAFVIPGSALDGVTHERIETYYSPDVNALLHPPGLAEGAASLLPGEVRPAVVWTIDIDPSGVTTAIDVRRALVQSREKLGYPQAQVMIDTGRADPVLALLPEVGHVLEEAERARGGISLALPSQEILEGDCTYYLAYVSPLPVEEWNAQLSLLTGRAAASIMLQGGIGILRTMPPAEERDVARLRRVAQGLGIEWPDTMSYPELLRALDARSSPAQAAFLSEATVLFRGVGYTAFDGELPDNASHAAIAAPYAHCTAPLRRLVDRYSSEVCLAVAAGDDVPGWARSTLPELPTLMAEGDRRAGVLDRANLDLVEATLLEPFVGREGDAIVVDVWKDGRGEIALRLPAVVGPCDAPLELGSETRVRLTEADPARRSVCFAPAAETASSEPRAG